MPSIVPPSPCHVSGGRSRWHHFLLDHCLVKSLDAKDRKEDRKKERRRLTSFYSNDDQWHRRRPLFHVSIQFQINSLFIVLVLFDVICDRKTWFNLFLFSTVVSFSRFFFFFCFYVFRWILKLRDLKTIHRKQKMIFLRCFFFLNKCDCK